MINFADKFVVELTTIVTDYHQEANLLNFQLYVFS